MTISWLTNNLGTSFHESYQFVDVLFRNLALMLVVHYRAATLLSDSLSHEQIASESRHHGPKQTILDQILPNEPVWSSTCYNNPMASSHYGDIMGPSHEFFFDFSRGDQLMNSTLGDSFDSIPASDFSSSVNSDLSRSGLR
jgi:hypothetical protein